MLLVRSATLPTLLVGFFLVGMSSVAASSAATTTFEDGLSTIDDYAKHTSDTVTTVRRRRRATATATRSQRRMTDGKGKGKKGSSSSSSSSSSKKKLSKKSGKKSPTKAPTASPVAGPTTDDTIADIACSTPGFEILCSLVVAAGLGDDLSSTGPFTVFAPTNEAFVNFLDATGISLPDPIDRITNNDPLLGTITDILLYHVVSGEVLKSDLRCDAQVPTLLGQDSQTQCLNVGMGEQSFFQIGDATLPLLPPQIVMFDIRAANGIIHVVNNVILP